MLPFPCYGCGMCCRMVDVAEETRPLDRGDGICKHLDTDTNRCTIYEKRPDICRVDKQYELHGKDKTWPEFIELTLEACDLLNTEDLQTTVKQWREEVKGN